MNLAASQQAPQLILVMATVTADDLVLIDVGHYMLGSIYLKHVLDEVVAANIVEVMRSNWRRVVVEDVAERVIAASYAAPARIGLLDEYRHHLLKTALVGELL
jgi:hypothetical protein